jgi:hypothetical protein
VEVNGVDDETNVTICHVYEYERINIKSMEDYLYT